MKKETVIKHDLAQAPVTGDWRYMCPEVNKKKCIGCQTCVPFCPEASIEMQAEKGEAKEKADIDYHFCKGCGVCAQVCPVQAITMKKKC